MKPINCLYLAAVIAGLYFSGSVASAQTNPITYNTGADGAWDTTTADWVLGAPTGSPLAPPAGSATDFVNLDTAYFTASTAGTITIASGGVSVSNSSNTANTNRTAFDVTGGAYTFNGGSLTFSGSGLTGAGSDQYLQVASGASATFNDLVTDNVGSFYVLNNGSSGTATFTDGLAAGTVAANGSGSAQLYLGSYGTGTVNLAGGAISSSFTLDRTSAVNLYGGAIWGVGQQLQIGGGSTTVLTVGNSTTSGTLNDFSTGYAAIQIGASNNAGEIDLKAGAVNSYNGITVMIGNGTNTGNSGTLLVEGGTLTTDTQGTGTQYGITLNPTSDTSAGSTGTSVFTVTGGTVNTDGITFGGAQAVGATYSTTVATSATLNISGGTTYVGSLGINKAAVAPTTNTVNLSGGTIGASAAWSSNMAMNLTTGTNGNVTFKTANSSNAAENITLNGVLSGTGGINITGPGVFTLSNTNTYSGTTDVLTGATLNLTSNLALASTSTLTLDTSTSVVDLNFTGYDFIAALNIDGTAEAAGIYSASALNNGTGSGFIDVGNVAVPEPGTWALLLGGLGFLVFVRRCRRANF
jgi:fibronectin-binding autotransporter adhesin